MGKVDPAEPRLSKSADSNHRPRRLVKTIFVVIAIVAFSLALLLVAVVLVRGSSSSKRVLDSAATIDELSRLADGRGFIAAPPVTGPGALDSSAWAALFLQSVGSSPMPISASSVRSAANIGEDPVWEAFYEESLGANPAVTPQLLEAVTKNAKVSDSDRDAVAAAVLRIWAGVTAVSAKNLPTDDRNALSSWLSARMNNCDLNVFTGFYAKSTLVALNPSTVQSWSDTFSTCDFNAMPATAVAPTNEVDLLSAFAAAAWRERVGHSASIRKQQEVLRSMLAPEGSMAYDPWWAYYAASGFLAAGGNKSAYADVAAIMESHASPSGLMPESTLPVSNIQTTYAAVSILVDFGVAAPRSLSLSALGNPSDLMDGHDWSDPEWAAWGTIMANLGLQPSANLRSELEAHVSACLRETVTVASARGVGLCRETARHFGWSSTVKVDWSLWQDAPSAELVDAIAALRLAPGNTQSRQAINDVVKSPADQSTTVIADAILAAKVVGIRLTNDDKRALSSVLKNRMAAEPFSGFVRDSTDDINPSLNATARVAELDRWNLLADS
jgi:citrate lyase gamma subunit